SYMSLKRRIIQFKSYEDPESLKQLDTLISKLQSYYDLVPEERQMAIWVLQSHLSFFVPHKPPFARHLIEEYF
ncbi:hypothetical protein ACEF17_13345, partial [Streptococcus hyovaginalis]